MPDTLATDGLAAAPAPAPAAAAGGTAAPAPADAGGGAPVTPAPGAAATPPVTPAAGTAGAAPTPPAATPAAADANWRATFAQGDAELAKRLERFAAPGDFIKSYREMERKMSSGELKRAAPAADASPEDVKAWRAESGIPDSPEGYFEKIELPTGVTMGEADKPLANSFAEYAHKANMTPAQVSQAMAWYYDTLDKQTLGSEEADATFKVQARDALHGEWRGDFKANINAAQSVIQQFPDDVRERLFGGRTVDGKIVGNDPGVLKALANLGRELNPLSTVLPAGHTTLISAESRKAEIEALMKSPNASTEYWAKPAVQEEYRNIVEKMQIVQARG